MDNIPFETLKGKVIQDIKVNKETDEIIFIVSSLENYLMYHRQDCCESVVIDDICGDLTSLIGSPVLVAEERSNSDGSPKQDYYEGSHTWTFYELATINGSVTIRWYGSSNGYYSERVDFVRINDFLHGDLIIKDDYNGRWRKATDKWATHIVIFTKDLENNEDRMLFLKKEDVESFKEFLFLPSIIKESYDN